MCEQVTINAEPCRPHVTHKRKECTPTLSRAPARSTYLEVGAAGCNRSCAGSTPATSHWSFTRRTRACTGTQSSTRTFMQTGETAHFHQSMLACLGPVTIQSRHACIHTRYGTPIMMSHLISLQSPLRALDPAHEISQLGAGGVKSKARDGPTAGTTARSRTNGWAEAQAVYTQSTLNSTRRRTHTVAPHPPYHTSSC